MSIKLIRAMFFWGAIIFLYIAAKIVKLDFIFTFIAATFFIPVISKIINNERYNQLALKQESLRAIYELADYIKSPTLDGRQRPIADSYPALDKAIQNSGIFVDKRITRIMYDFFDAIHIKDHERIHSINIEYLNEHLQKMSQKTTLGNYLIQEVVVPIVFELPSQILKFKKIEGHKKLRENV